MNRALESRALLRLIRVGAGVVLSGSILCGLTLAESLPVFGWSAQASAGATVRVGPFVSPQCANPSFAGALIIVGTEGPDVIDLSGGPARDAIVVGLGGNDRIKGGPGRNCVDAGAGDDQVEGGPRDDILLGGDGDDRIAGRGGSDVMDGGRGVDRCQGDRRSTFLNCEKTTR